MRVTVRLYGPLAQTAGCDALEVALPPGSRVADLLAAARARLPIDGSIRPTVGTDYVDDQRELADGDVVHLIPPVGGG